MVRLVREGAAAWSSRERSGDRWVRRWMTWRLVKARAAPLDVVNAATTVVGVRLLHTGSLQGNQCCWGQ